MTPTAAAPEPPDGLPVDPRWVTWMAEALDLAATCEQDVPVGALLYDESGVLLGRGRNERERRGDPAAHAEVEALRDASASRGSWRLDGCTLVVTLEPCVMCAGALVAARVSRVVMGAWDPKAGAVGSVWDVVRDHRSLHRPEVVGGVLEDRCSRVLSDFFAQRRSV